MDEIMNLVKHNEKKDILEGIEKLLMFLDKNIRFQETTITQIQFSVIARSFVVLISEINTKELTNEQVLETFTKSIYQQIESHEKPEYFVGLNLAINNFLSEQQ